VVGCRQGVFFFFGGFISCCLGCSEYRFIAWDFMDVSISEEHGVALQWLDHIWQKRRHILWRWF